MATRVRPLLFLDVDGTVLPLGCVQLPATLEEWSSSWQSASNPHLARVVQEHGSRLLRMPCDLMWATAWMADANAVLAPLLGLPELPVVELGELPAADEPVWSEVDGRAGLNWKTRTLVEVAAGRPFAWIDDEVTEADRQWVSANHHAEALIHRVDADCGLTERDLTVVEDWSRALWRTLPRVACCL